MRLAIFRRLFRLMPLVLLVASVMTVAAPPVVRAQEVRSEVRADPAARAEEERRLFRYLGQARNETEGRQIEMEIWIFWLAAPDREAADLMNEALKHRRQYDLAGAREILDRLVEHAPGWAEAWDQRATVRFEQGDDEGSLSDIERTLSLEPRHFGAMAGQAIILVRQGRMRAARSILEKAVAIHPFLAERSLLLATPPEDERGI